MQAKTQKLSASQEDYLEAIYNLSAETAAVRCRDIADLQQVTRASVTGALRSLAGKKLIHYKPYGYITLTETGRVAAQRVARRHQVIETFFVDVLGLDQDLSRKAACRAEHTLGSEIINRLTLFIEFIVNSGKVSLSEFETYYKNGSKR